MPNFFVYAIDLVCSLNLAVHGPPREHFCTVYRSCTKAAVKSNATTEYVGAVRPYRPCKIRHGVQPLIASL